MDFVQLLREERRRAYGTTASTCLLSSESKPAAIGKINEGPLLQGRLKVWTNRSKIDINEFQVRPIPGVFYIPNWITPDEEEAISERVYTVPDDNNKWVKLRHRRLQMWGGEVKIPFDRQPLPQWLEQISQTLVDIGVFTPDQKPNHALINEYDVEDYILPHEDGPAYHPLVSIISTGAECRVTFEPHRALASCDSGTTFQRFAFQLQRRSLLIFTGEAYTGYLHSIDKIQDDSRISLTMRHVAL